MPDRPQSRWTSAVRPASPRPLNAEGGAPDRGDPGPVESIEAGVCRALERDRAGQDGRIRRLEARIAERDRLGRTLRDRLTERGLYATWLESEVERRDRRLGELVGRLADRSAEFDRFEAEVAALRASRTWRVVAAIGRAADRLRSLKRGVMLLPPRALRAVRGGASGPSGDGVRLPDRSGRGRPRPRAGIREAEASPPGVADDPGHPGDSRAAEHEDGPGRRPRSAPPRSDPASESTGDAHAGDAPESAPDRDPNAILRFIPPREDPYDAWLRNNAWDGARALEAERALDRLPERPTISVVVSTIGVEPSRLRASLASLREQVYPDREVILVGGSEAVAASLSGRASVVASDADRPIEALRAAADRASGDYLVLLDGGACLAPDALLEFAGAAVDPAEPPVLIFADEDRVDAKGGRFGPRFRPGWSPELLLSTPSTGRAFAVRRSAYEQVGGLRPEFEAAWPHDLALRLAELPGTVTHLPRVLVHVPAGRGDDDPIDCAPARQIALGARAVAEAIGRRGIEARVSRPDWADRRQFPAFELDFPDRGPRVAVVIPTRDRVDLLRRCIDSVLGRTSYRDFEVVVIDDGSTDPETLDYLDRLGPPCRVVRIEGEAGRFNYARIHDEAIRALGEEIEFVALLNNDTEVRREEWLSQLVGYGRMPGVGAVGARLLYADGRVQHAGILTDLDRGEPGHAFRLLPWWGSDEQRLSRVARNVAAVTAACLLVRREAFLDLGGFDDRRFAVGYNDVDLCLRLGERGLRSVYAPRAELFHFEGASRGFEDDPREAASYREAWGRHVDPHHHPSSARRDERLGLNTRRTGPLGVVADRGIRALIVADRLDATGDARFAAILAEGLRDRSRIAPEVRARVDGPIGEVLRAAGIPVEVDPGSDQEGPIERARALADLLGRGDHDLVHAVGLDGFEAVHAARLAGLPALWTVREAVDFRDAFGHLDDEAARLAIEAFSDAYRVAFPAWGIRRPYHPVESRWNFEVVPEVMPPPAVIPDRSESRRRLGLARSAALITCPIDLEDDGLLDVLDAVSELLRAGREVVARLVGPPGRARMPSGIDAARRLGDRVRWIPWDADPAAWLAATDVLAGVSRRSLSPATISLGRSFGLPMVLADVPGVDEYVRPGRTALLFAPGDSASLADRIARLLDDPGRRDRLATAARADGGRVGSFEEMIASYERLSLEAVAVGADRPRNAPPAGLGGLQDPDSSP